MKFSWLLPCLLIILASCTPATQTDNIESPVDSREETSSNQETDSPNEITVSPTDENSEDEIPDSKTQATQKLSPPTSETQTISANSIGEAKIGMTLGELKAQLKDEAEFEVVTPFMVDLDAISVSKNGEVQYYIAYFSYEPITDSDPIKILLTDNPNYRTSEGVGPTTLIKEAESVYGDAKLQYNSDYESREYIEFAQQPAENIIFRSNGSLAASKGFAGIYGNSQDEYGSYFETTKYRDDGAISSIMIDGSRPNL
ncbi:hypothetical protein [Oscillatoria salina]|uniref:hypothetical protein n=1 Tax=Oscillatoria salina TaxID=331517 RepID=UPI0013B90CB5|nr:hypothetical protein [Oscillatoria salina]MBZ8179827.1 hypothetical protein [Oscillatoria salina IIICB1]NET88102.1 hypothetical protein [Kamptonema sp. SIO1D9]